MAAWLGLVELEQREVLLADGHRRRVRSAESASGTGITKVFWISLIRPGLTPIRHPLAHLIPLQSITMPLRPASDFPLSPDPELLQTTYQECRAALVSANRSRGALKFQSDKRGVVIAELQRELVELEADLADEARAKARLHALNRKLGSVIRELEDTGDAMVGLIDESERQSGYWLVDMFRRLIEQAKRWRSVKARAAALAAEAAGQDHPSNQIGGPP